MKCLIKIRCSINPMYLDSDLYLIQIDTMGNYSITLCNLIATIFTLK